MRLTLVCVSAAKLPMVMEASAEIQTSGSQRAPIGSNAVMKMRRKTANAAAFGPAERNAVTGDGRALVNVRRPDLERRARDLEAQPHEHQRRRDAQEHAARARCRPAHARRGSPSGSSCRWRRRSSATPYRKNAVANEPSRKYFSAASLARLSSRR